MGTRVGGGVAVIGLLVCFGACAGGGRGGGGGGASASDGGGGASDGGGGTRGGGAAVPEQMRGKWFNSSASAPGLKVYDTYTGETVGDNVTQTLVELEVTAVGYSDTGLVKSENAGGCTLSVSWNITGAAAYTAGRVTLTPASAWFGVQNTCAENSESTPSVPAETYTIALGAGAASPTYCRALVLERTDGLRRELYRDVGAAGPAGRAVEGCGFYFLCIPACQDVSESIRADCYWKEGISDWSGACHSCLDAAGFQLLDPLIRCGQQAGCCGQYGYCDGSSMGCIQQACGALWNQCAGDNRFDPTGTTAPSPDGGAAGGGCVALIQCLAACAEEDAACQDGCVSGATKENAERAYDLITCAGEQGCADDPCLQSRCAGAYGACTGG